MTDGGADAALVTEAVVLGRTAVAESDLIVTLFTRSLGRVGAVARGARRSKRRFASGLEMLTVMSVTLGRRRRGAELWSLDDATVIDDHRGLASDPIVLGHASYALELVRELAPPEAADPAILELVIALWRGLAPGPSPALLRRFELALCEAVGSAVALDHCAACGRVDLGAHAVFDPGRGGVVCAACAARSTGLGVRPLDLDARTYLQALAAVELDEARAIDASAEARTAARDAMLAVVTHLIGHAPATLAYVAQVHGGLRRS